LEASSDPTVVTICGGGNGAHTLVPLIQTELPHANVNIYTSLSDEAETLRTTIEARGPLQVVDASTGQVLTGIPHTVTSDPATVIPQSDLVMLVVPAFAHRDLLESISPHLRPGTCLGALPARSGFEFEAHRCLKGAGLWSQVTVFGLKTLPWACRIEEFGHRAHIHGYKNRVEMAAVPRARAIQLADLLTRITRTVVEPCGSFLGLTLGNMGQVIHPSILYGLFRDAQHPVVFREGTIPPFYQSVTEEVGQVLQDVGTEIGRIRDRLSAVAGKRLDLSAVKSPQEWLLAAYEGQIEDTSSLATCFRTNHAYRGLKVPTRPHSPDTERPASQCSAELHELDLQNRYLTEDIPYGLLVTRAIAALVGVETPTIDEVISAAQKWTGRAYLVDGSFTGEDVSSSRIPQNYGLSTLEDLVEFANTIAV